MRAGEKHGSRIRSTGSLHLPDASRRSSTVAGKCVQCGMDLLPEGTRFALARHLLSNPLHLVSMLVLMAIAMMVMR